MYRDMYRIHISIVQSIVHHSPPSPPYQSQVCFSLHPCYCKTENDSRAECYIILFYCPDIIDINPRTARWNHRATPRKRLRGRKQNTRKRAKLWKCVWQGRSDNQSQFNDVLLLLFKYNGKPVANTRNMANDWLLLLLRGIGLDKYSTHSSVHYEYSILYIKAQVFDGTKRRYLYTKRYTKSNYYRGPTIANQHFLLAWALLYRIQLLFQLLPWPITQFFSKINGTSTVDCVFILSQRICLNVSQYKTA